MTTATIERMELRERKADEESRRRRAFIRKAAIAEAIGEANDNDPQEIDAAIMAEGMTADEYRAIVDRAVTRIEQAKLAAEVPSLQAAQSEIEVDDAQNDEEMKAAEQRYKLRKAGNAHKRASIDGRMARALTAAGALPNECNDQELLEHERKLTARGKYLADSIRAIEEQIKPTAVSDGGNQRLGNQLSSVRARIREVADNKHARQLLVKLQAQERYFAGEVADRQAQIEAMKIQKAEIDRELVAITAEKCLP